MPGAFSPSPSILVISEACMGRLEGLGMLAFARICFEKLVYFGVGKGYAGRATQHGEEYDKHVMHHTLLQQFPDATELHARVGIYYELLCAAYQHIPPAAFAQDELTKLSVRLGSDYFHQRTIAVSQGLMREYAILRDRLLFLCTEDAHGVLSDYIDWDFYTVAWYKLP